MKAIYLRRTKSRVPGGKIKFVWAFLFFFGFCLGFFYHGGSGTSMPAQAVLKSQFFCGDTCSLPEVAAALPRSDEGEGAASIKHWDVSYYDDAVTGEEIPVFVKSIATDEGESSSTSALAKAPQDTLALTALESDTPQVLIYSTHTSESYSGGGTVVDVAHALKDNLYNTYGIGAVVSDTVHDSPEWYKSYANSRQTAADMLAAYPDAKLLIDLHRDSGVAKSTTTLNVDGTDMASLLLVVGSNLTMEHPNWEANLATAETVGACINEVNSEILRGVRVQKGRYNQHLTANAILLEVGTDLNTLAEAQASTKIAAEAINNYLNTGV